MSNFKLFGSTSRKISKHFNGRALCPDLLKALWLQHLPEDENKSLHCVYKMIDKTNDWEYIGKFKASSYSKFATYIGSGSLLRFQVAKKGIQNFEFHFIAFFDNKKAAATLEKTLVNKNYLKTANTYNLIVGGDNKNNWKSSQRYMHDPVTNRTFNCDAVRVEKLQKDLGFVLGISAEDIEKQKRTPAKVQTNKNQKYFKLTKDMMGEQVFINAAWDKVDAYLNLGWEFTASRVWMHKPSATNTYVRGTNWTQPASHNIDKILDMLAQGWVMGRPPKYDTNIATTPAGRKKRGRRINGKYIDNNVNLTQSA